MSVQKCSDLIVSHQLAGTQTRQIAVKHLEAGQQGIRYHIGLRGKAFAMQAAEAAQQVRYSGSSAERLEKQQLIVENMRGPSVGGPQHDLADFVDPVDQAVDPVLAVEGVRNRPQLQQVVVDRSLQSCDDAFCLL